jgi:FkbM family methyltransferase
MHVGAHLAEEYQEYKDQNWIDKFSKRAIWVEAQPDLASKLQESLDKSENLVYNFAVWEENGKSLEFNIANNSQSSSLFELSKHAEIYPQIKYVERIMVETIRLETLLGMTELEPDFLNLDIQGAELIALKSLGSRINNFKWIYTEVNKEYVYKGCALVSEIDEFLASANFTRVATRWVKGKGWGDALYIHQEYLPPKYKYLLGTFSNAFWRISPHAKYLTDQLRAARNRILFKQGKRIKISE